MKSNEERVAEALESIARSLYALTNPPVSLKDFSDKFLKPQADELHKHYCTVTPKLDKKFLDRFRTKK